MLKLIAIPRAGSYILILVSIHPMLKLIRKSNATGKCSVCFNTSHVKVNPGCGCTHGFLQPVSIHPMLKLIKRFTPSPNSSLGFNTSHVKVNRERPYSSGNVSSVSIHPMLKLIQRISRIPYNTLYQISQYLSTF